MESEKRGHDWKKNPDGSIDIFAFEKENHNGPVCLRCERSGCHHCNPSIYDEVCPV